MCTRSASERIDVRASLMSSLRINRSGPSNGLTERPTPDCLDVCLVDTWSVINSPSSRLSLILPEIWDRSLEGETIECHIVYPTRIRTTFGPTQDQAHARAGRAHTPGGRRLDHGNEQPSPADRAHRSALRERPDARADAGAVPRRCGSSGTS